MRGVESEQISGWLSQEQGPRKERVLLPHKPPSLNRLEFKNFFSKPYIRFTPSAERRSTRSGAVSEEWLTVFGRLEGKENELRLSTTTGVLPIRPLTEGQHLVIGLPPYD